MSFFLILLMILILYSMLREAGRARQGGSQPDGVARASSPLAATAPSSRLRREMASHGQELPPPPPPPPLPHQVRNRGEISDVYAFLPDYQVEYTDAHGISTDRRLTIKHVDHQMITAYCHLRRAIRHFYSPRISRCVNCSTGEIIVDIHMDMVKERQRYLNNQRGKVVAGLRSRA
jgi:hypothetical protein